MDGWTRSCAFIHVFSLSCTLQNFLQKVWTGGQALKILIILMTKIMYFIIQKCGYVDKKLSFYFISSFYLLPFKFLAKSVDRWTSSEKNQPHECHSQHAEARCYPKKRCLRKLFKFKKFSIK